MNLPGSKSKPIELLVMHVLAFAFFMGFPGLVTMLAPASWITFVRTGETVSCTTRTCLYFVVPYQTQHVEQVTEITDRERAATTRRERIHGRNTGKTIHVDGEGFLQIHGMGDQLAEVSVSPVSLKNAVDKSVAFLNNKSAQSTTFFVIANWKFGGIMGGILTLFTLLYVVGFGLGFLQFLANTVKKLIP